VQQVRVGGRDSLDEFGLDHGEPGSGGGRRSAASLPAALKVNTL
jgi:hypothetical protein